MIRRKYNRTYKQRNRERAQEAMEELKDMDLPYYPPTAAKRNLELLEQLIKEGHYD